MRSTRFVLLSGAPLALVALLLISPAVAKEPPVHSVRGHGVWERFATGLPEGGNNFNQLSINAWQDQDGTAHGILEWTYDTNPLPGGGGQTISGYPWTVAIDGLIMLDVNVAYVEGVIINSGQVPGDIGQHVGVYVVDNGNGPDDPPDELNGSPIDAGGNFTVR